jgi:hypothetical protein
VIVRIATEGQFKLDDDSAEKLNELDNAVVTAIETGDKAKFKEAFDALIAFVHDNGTELDDDALEESDVIVPPGDTTLEEAATEFTGDGLIPG